MSSKTRLAECPYAACSLEASCEMSSARDGGLIGKAGQQWSAGTSETVAAVTATARMP